MHLPFDARCLEVIAPGPVDENRTFDDARRHASQTLPATRSSDATTGLDCEVGAMREANNALAVSRQKPILGEFKLGARMRTPVQIDVSLLAPANDKHASLPARQGEPASAAVRDVLEATEHESAVIVHGQDA
jgi:hypothetical protein